MSVLCKTLKNVQVKGTEIIWFSLHPLPGTEGPNKDSTKTPPKDNNLLNFNFLAVPLLACTPRPTQKSPEGRTITGY